MVTAFREGAGEYYNPLNEDGWIISIIITDKDDNLVQEITDLLQVGRYSPLRDVQEIGMSLASQHFIKMDCRTIISYVIVPNKHNRELAKNAKIFKSEISCDNVIFKNA